VTTASPRAGRARTRRGPADLPFSFADRGLAEALAAEREEPDWLRADRVAAIERSEALALETNPLYTGYLDLRAADLSTARPYVRTASAGSSGEAGVGTSDRLPDGLSALIELREDTIPTLAIAPEAAAAGVVVESFGAALRRDPDGLRAAIEGGAGLPDDKLAQLVRGVWSQGVRVVVPDGVRLERPIVVRWAAGEPGRALVTRTSVRLGREAAAAVVEEIIPSGPGGIAPDAPQSLVAGTFEAAVGPGAALEVASIQELGPTAIVLQQRAAGIGDGGSLRWALAQLGGRIVRARNDNRLEGDRSSVEQVEIVFGAGEQLVDLTTYTRHLGRDTTGNVLSKGALRDRARMYLKGMAIIDRSAIGTDSFLGEYGMNLSKGARSVAIPSLEIDQPDCRRAAHSSSVGPIDETQVFYLESRGIPDDEARKFIVLGYLEPVVARVPWAPAEERLRALLSARWDEGRPAAEAA